MVQNVHLADFTASFLSAQGLENFELTFQPHLGKRNRRAKRGTVVIQASTHEVNRQVQGSRTVADLIERFHTLAKQTREWTLPGPDCYKVRLCDHLGRTVDDSEEINGLRTLQEDLKNKALTKAEKTFQATLKDFERELEPKDIVFLVKSVLKERYSN